MSFQGYLYKIKQIKTKRKEKGSFLTQYTIHFHLSKPTKERTSVFTPRGSITLEAALAVSFFFFAVVSIVYLFEIMVLKTQVKSALYAVGRETAQEVYQTPGISASKMEQKMIETFGKERLQNSLIVNGSRGFDCSGSKRQGNTTIMDLKVAYRIKIPVFMFQIPVISKEETLRVKGWTGYEVSFPGLGEDAIVYVTDHGLVYHADMHCSYLDLSIRAVKESEIKSLRNQNGGRYKECTSCDHHKGADFKVYITDYGEKYHWSLECHGLKRNVHAMPLKDVYGLGGCSKCVK